METFDNNHSEDNITEEFEPKTNTQPSAPENQPKHRFGLRKAVSAVLALALVVGSCGLTYAAVNNKWEDKMQEATASISSMQQQLNALRNSGSVSATNVTYAVSPEGAQTPRMVYENNAKSVVAVSSTIRSTVYGQTREGTSSGSGFIISDDGYVVTNRHVVEGATDVTVTLSTGDEYTAKVIGSDSLNDVALLKVEATGLPAVKLGSSDKLAIGDMVCAIGNPLGSLTATLTVGYVSGKDRQVTTDNSTINMIQTDAAINSGNSGGPLFNMYGEVVGITSAKYSGTTSSGASIEGISFAIPIDDVMSIIDDLQEYGYVTGAYLGVTVTDTDAAAAKLYGMPTGAYVNSVEDGGAADRAGVQPKDIIIGLGDTDISNRTELTRVLRRFKAGDTTTITVIRSGERMTMDITLDEKPRDTQSSAGTTDPTQPQDGSYDEWYKFFFGGNQVG